MTKPAPIVLEGLSASRGLAIGRIALCHRQRASHRRAGAPPGERAALETAIAEAAAQLDALAAKAGRMAAEILEFQIALLEDDDLILPILARIAAGEPADRAWSAALEREIADYAAAEDETFAARAGDLADLRERVLAVLMPGMTGPSGNGADDRILVAEDLTPSRFLETDWSRCRGAALQRGSLAGHVALLARARGTPLIVGLGRGLARLPDGATAVLDADAGRLTVHPDAATLAMVETRLQARAARAPAEAELQGRPAITANGEPVAVLVNVDDPSLLVSLDPGDCDGVGLTRTEFLFQGPGLPDEERQLAAYADVLRWAAGRPVVIRTLDAGGDKPIAGLTPEGERNPFLGLRGLRLSLARPEVFRVQLRALARAAVLGPLKVMAPMVSLPDEFEAFRQLFDDVLGELALAGIAAARPALGMMVEVPAAALNLGAFGAEFVSIGSNDLIQYVMAASRDEPAVRALYRPQDPAVLELIRRVVEVGAAQRKAISLCGEMASDAALVPILLDVGLRCLSVAPAAIGPVKAAIAAWPPPSPAPAAGSGPHG